MSDYLPTETQYKSCMNLILLTIINRDIKLPFAHRKLRAIAWFDGFILFNDFYY